jgi:tetratricopeptide (TPR) repeat protein
MAEGTKSLDESASEALPAAAAAPSTEEPPVSVGDCLDRYTVREHIGAGGMGEVFAAHDAELDRLVALKVIKPGLAGASPAARARFRREAQAMARLNHPNVVSVFDVGEVGRRVFVAMELVRGPTMAAWLADRTRSWREIVAVFLQAGRGLEAAHAAGIVHRDFKPSNVILGDRVRVADFGLARAVDAAEEEVPSSSSPCQTPLQGTVTHTGHTVGTPPYMAPEQGAAPASPLSDQYSFAVALHEALFGARPGEPAPARKVPARLRAIVARGLAERPEDRYPSMRDLLADLERDPARTRRRWLSAVGAVGLSVASIWFARSAARGPSCEGLAAPLAAAWNKSKADAVRARFTASGLGYAAVAADRVIEGLDAYAARWTSSRTNACTQARAGVQSQELLDRRMRCLDQRLVEVTTVIGELVSATPATIRSAGAAVDTLHPLEDCDDPHESVARPVGDKVRADIVQAESILSRAWALQALDQPERALPLARQASEIAVRTQWAPLQARALVLRGECENRTRDYQHALETFDQAAKVGAQGKEDAVVVDALAGRFFILGEKLGKMDEALAGRKYIELALERAGQPPRSRAIWLHNLAVVLLEQEHFDDALTAESEAVSIWRKIVSAGHVYLLDSLETEGNIQTYRHEFDRAEALLKEVLSAKIAARGPEHVTVARTILNLGEVEAERGNVAKAIELWERTREIQQAAGAVELPTQVNLGLGKLLACRWRAAADDLATALAMAEREAPGKTRWVGICADGLGTVLAARGELDRAAPLLDRAIEALRESGGGSVVGPLVHASRLALVRGDRATAKARLEEAEKAAPADNPMIALARADLARAETGCRGARAGYERAVSLAKKQFAKDVESDATPGLAECQLELGAPAAAVSTLEPHVKWLADMHADPEAAAPAQFALARALIATHGDSGWARSLATQAQTGFAKTPRAAEVARWLAKH